MATSEFRALEFEAESQRPKRLLMAGLIAGFSFALLVFGEYQQPLLPVFCFLANLVCCIAGASRAVQLLKFGLFGRVVALLLSLTPLINGVFALFLLGRLLRAVRTMKGEEYPPVSVPKKKTPTANASGWHPGNPGETGTKPLSPIENVVALALEHGNLVVFALIGLALAASSIRSGLSEIEFANGLTSTAAGLLDSEYKVVTRKKRLIIVSTTYRVKYRFVADGVERTQIEYLDEEPALREVTVRYNPQRPEESRIEIGRPYLAAFGLAAIFGGLAIVMLVAIYKQRGSVQRAP